MFLKPSRHNMLATILPCLKKLSQMSPLSLYPPLNDQIYRQEYLDVSSWFRPCVQRRHQQKYQTCLSCIVHLPIFRDQLKEQKLFVTEFISFSRNFSHYCAQMFSITGWEQAGLSCLLAYKRIRAHHFTLPYETWWSPHRKGHKIGDSRKLINY